MIGEPTPLLKDKVNIRGATGNRASEYRGEHVLRAAVRAALQCAERRTTQGHAMAAALHFFKDDVPAGPHSFRRQIQFAVAARRAPRHASVGENTPPSPCRQVVVVRTPRVRRKKVAARRLLKVVLITLSRRQGNGIEARRAAPPQLAAPERRAAAATAHFWNPACKWCKQMATAGIFARLAAMRWQASQAGGVSPMSGCAAAVAPGADEAAPAAGRLGCASGSASGSGSGTTAATASGQGGIGARLPLGRQPSRTPASMSTTASRSPDAAGAVATPELATHCTNDSCHHRYDDHVRSAGSGAGAGSALAVAMDRVPAPGMAAPPMPAMRIRVPVQHDCAPGGALSPAGTPGARRRRLLRGGGGDDSSAAPPLPLSLSQATAGVGGRAVRMTGGPFSPTVASPGAASPHVAAVALSDGEEVGTPSRRALRRVPGATTTAAPVPPPSTTTTASMLSAACPPPPPTTAPPPYPPSMLPSTMWAAAMSQWQYNLLALGLPPNTTYAPTIVSAPLSLPASAALLHAAHAAPPPASRLAAAPPPPTTSAPTHLRTLPRQVAEAATAACAQAHRGEREASYAWRAQAPAAPPVRRASGHADATARQQQLAAMDAAPSPYTPPSTLAAATRTTAPSSSARRPPTLTVAAPPSDGWQAADGTPSSTSTAGGDEAACNDRHALHLLMRAALMVADGSEGSRGGSTTTTGTSSGATTSRAGEAATVTTTAVTATVPPVPPMRLSWPIPAAPLLGAGAPATAAESPAALRTPGSSCWGAILADSSVSTPSPCVLPPPSDPAGMLPPRPLPAPLPLQPASAPTPHRVVAGAAAAPAPPFLPSTSMLDAPAPSEDAMDDAWLPPMLRIGIRDRWQRHAPIPTPGSLASTPGSAAAASPSPPREPHGPAARMARRPPPARAPGVTPLASSPLEGAAATPSPVLVPAMAAVTLAPAPTPMPVAPPLASARAPPPQPQPKPQPQAQPPIAAAPAAPTRSAVTSSGAVSGGAVSRTNSPAPAVSSSGTASGVKRKRPTFVKIDLASAGGNSGGGGGGGGGGMAAAPMMVAAAAPHRRPAAPAASVSARARTAGRAPPGVPSNHGGSAGVGIGPSSGSSSGGAAATIFVPPKSAPLSVGCQVAPGTADCSALVVTRLTRRPPQTEFQHSAVAAVAATASMSRGAGLPFAHSPSSSATMAGGDLGMIVAPLFGGGAGGSGSDISMLLGATSGCVAGGGGSDDSSHSSGGYGGGRGGGGGGGGATCYHGALLDDVDSSPSSVAL